MPFISTIIYSFSNVIRVTETDVTGSAIGTVTEWVGFDNYKYVWNVHGTFKETLFSSFTGTLLDVLLILIFSLIVAVVLNSKFRGRAFVRAVFFMPVIFNSQAIDAAMAAGSALTDAMEESGQDIFSTMFNFSDFLTNANIPVVAVNFLTTASDSIFDVISYSGVQILIFLSGIQSVPKHLYEAAKMEGATQYEMFWKITLPMVSAMIPTVVVYTVVDSYLRSSVNTVIATYAKDSNYGVHAAMSWIYLGVVALFLIIVLGILSKVVFYYDN